MIVRSRELMPVIREALGRGQRVRLTATGHSMWPFVHEGDVVELEPASGQPRVGQVVLVQCSEESYLVHRVVRTKADTYFLRGDAQRYIQGPFFPGDLLGRAILSNHRGRLRALDRGAWRLAGMVWMRAAPLGILLCRLAHRMRARGQRHLRRPAAPRASLHNR